MCALEPASAARLAGVLNLLGAATALSDRPGEAADASAGFDAADLAEFQERLLADLGSPSDDPLPPATAASAPPAAARDLARLIESAAGDEPLCLFNDPRIARLGQLWIEALGKARRTTCAVLAFGHPLQRPSDEAAPSRAHWLALWLQQVLLAERFTRGTPRSVVLPEQVLSDWRAVAERLEAQLGLIWPRTKTRVGSSIDAFLSSAPPPGKAPADALDAESPLDALCAAAWDALGALSVRPDDAAAMAEMDRIARALDEAYAIAGPVVAGYQQIQSRLEAAKAELAELIAARDRHLEQADHRVAARDLRLAGQDELIAAQAAKIEALEAHALAQARAQDWQAVDQADVLQRQAERAETLKAMACLLYTSPSPRDS